MDIKIAILLPLFLSLAPSSAETTVLDPALYLYPSPPLIYSEDNREQWSRASRSTKLLAAIETIPTTPATSTTDEKESMENAETFWPRLRSIDYALKQVHIPVTFSFSGNYGGYKGSNGVIGSAYASVGGGTTSLFSYGKSALAGSGYGNYGAPVRIYSGSEGPAWSGWGNGKWGHYGKG